MKLHYTSFNKIRISQGDEMTKQYICYLNGKPYGKGNLEYMHELFHDYVINCKMHGTEEVSFKIIERSKMMKKSIQQCIEQNGEVLRRLADS